MSAAEIAKALGGRRAGRGWTAKCPAHKDRNPSLSIGENDDGRVLVHCFAGCEQDDVIGALKGLGLWPLATLATLAGRTPRNVGPRRPDDDNGRALELWNEAISIKGTIAEQYLESRGIILDSVPDIDSSLRFHPNCIFGTAKPPCLIALFTDIRTAKPKAIRRTALTLGALGALGGGTGPNAIRLKHENGDNYAPRTLGPSKDSCIRLWPDDCVEQGLVIGEGVETILAAATRVVVGGTNLRPAWACGGEGTLANFPILAGIEALTIIADNDAAGINAAQICAARWRNAGREVTTLRALNPDDDMNNVVIDSKELKHGNY